MSNTNEPPLPPGGTNPPNELPPIAAQLPNQEMRRQSGPLSVATGQQPGGYAALPTNGNDPGVKSTDDLFRILQLIWRHKILVFSLTMVATLTGFLLATRATPVFQSRSRLSVVYQAPKTTDWDPGPNESEYDRNIQSILSEAVSRNVMLLAADKIIERQDVTSMKDLSRDSIADILSAGANISPVLKTNHVIYAYNTVNKAEAQPVLGYLVAAFIDDQLRSESAGYRHTQDQLTIDEAVKHREYDQARETYNTFRIENHIDDSDPKPQQYAQSMADIKHNLSTVTSDVTQRQKQMEIVDANDDEKVLMWLKSSLGTGWLLQQQQQEFDDLMHRYNQRAEDYDENDPELKNLAALALAKHQEMIAIARTRYAQEQKELEAALATQAQLQSDLDKLQQEMNDRVPLLAKAQALKEQADIAGVSWRQLADAKLAASDTSRKRFTTIKRVEPSTDADQVYPRVTVFVAIGALCGLILSILIVLFWARIDDTLKNSVQVPRELGIPTLGTVLFSPAIGPDPSGLPLVARMPRSPEAEALFIVWANIATRLNLVPGTCKVLMLTSSIPEEGKSTTSANLASVAAQQNLRVLLIDLDLRRPSLHSYFGVTNAVGCIQALNRHMRREQCIQRTAVKNLDILTTGLGEDHPNELVSPQNLMGLLAWARGNYDLVVLDTPPLLLAADGLIVSRFIDGAVLVIHGGQTPLDTVQRSRDMLLGANTNLLGAILNDRTGAVDDRDRSYYYKYSSYYHQNSANE